MKVLLISPPWRNPNNGCLALATLRPLLLDSGLAVDTLYGNLAFPPTPSPVTLLESYTSFLFAPQLYPQVSAEEIVAVMLRQLLDDLCLDGVLLPKEQARFSDLGMDGEALRRFALADAERARVCIERCLDHARAPDYDIVGLSATFESQVPAALAIARRLRAARPEVKIILGGAACFEMQADGLVSSFPELDAVCHTEGEQVIVPLIRALRGELPLSSVPGIAYRDGEGAVVHNPSPPLLRSLDDLPIPRYDDFVAQFAASPWSDAAGEFGRPQLFFETSRGCWWGQKHLCSFCGLNAEGLSFRRKSPDRVLREISTLRERYPQADYLQATDNILDMGYLQDPLPRLRPLARAEERPLRMFFEVKANLRRDQVQVLAEGGIVDVQPGIESFSDEILANMDKGATALGQIQFIKYTQEAGIRPTYNLLLRNPGDRAEWYREMCELVPAIEHLTPPDNVVPCLLERFSPYHSEPGRYGISAVRPKPYYRALYPDPGVDLSRIAYIFDYDHPILHDEELRRAQRDFASRVFEWKRRYQAGLAFYREDGRDLHIVDRRPSARLAEARLGGTAAELYRYLHQLRPLSAITRRFHAVDQEILLGALDAWCHLRWLLRDRRERYLAVLPRLGPAPERQREPEPEPEPAEANVMAAKGHRRLQVV